MFHVKHEFSTCNHESNNYNIIIRFYYKYLKIKYLNYILILSCFIFVYFFFVNIKFHVERKFPQHIIKLLYFQYIILKKNIFIVFFKNFT